VQAGGLAPDIATIAAVFSEVLVSPSLPPDAIVREKASQLAALEEAMQDPLHAGFRALRHAAFGGTGYGLDSLGTPASLAALDRAALAAHHARHFNAANITLAIAGDFDPPSARPKNLAAGIFPAALPSAGKNKPFSHGRSPSARIQESGRQSARPHRSPAFCRKNRPCWPSDFPGLEIGKIGESRRSATRWR
jgi:hypothetical protein